jgi:TM2 domain-containing membrane protein YozV
MASAAASAMRLSPRKEKPRRSMLVAYVLWWWGTPLAAHRFYLGAHQSAVTMLGLFWGGLAIAAMMSKQSTSWVGGYAVPPPGIMLILIWMLWALLDAFLIPGLMKRYRAANETDELTHVFA